MKLRRFLRLLFNTLAAASLVYSLFGIAAFAIDIDFRWSHYLKTGDFRILGPPDAVNVLRQAEIKGLTATMGSTLLPLLWLFLWQKAKRDRRLLATGHCTKCGYDLRATPDRCPECGTVVPKY